MQKIYFLAFALVTFLSACSQNYGIRKTHVYYREMLPGTIQTNESGQKVGSRLKKEYWILIETDSVKFPVFSRAWIRSEAFPLKPQRVPGNKIALGKKRNSDEDVFVHAAPGKILWLLNTGRQVALKPNASVRNKLRKNPVVMIGKWNRKTFEYGIRKIDTLSSIMMQ